MSRPDVGGPQSVLPWAMLIYGGPDELRALIVGMLDDGMKWPAIAAWFNTDLAERSAKVGLDPPVTVDRTTISRAWASELGIE